MHTLKRRLAAKSHFVLIVILLMALYPHVRADDAPHRKPDVKTWKNNREQGQKAFEQKDYANAEIFFTAALTEARNFDAKDDRLAESLDDLARVYYLRNNLAAAEPLYRQLVEIRRGDPNAGLEAEALYGYGTVAERLRHYDDAAKAYERLETLLSRKLGRDHPETVMITFRRAMIFYKRQDFAQAEPLLKRCAEQFRNPASKITFRQLDPAAHGLQVFRHIYRPNYTYALQAYSRLAQIYLHQNQLPEAEQSMKQALDLVDEYAGKGDPEIPAVLKELSAFYFEMNNFPAAEPMLARLAKFQETNLGETNDATLITEDRLAGVYAQEKKDAQAGALYEKILAAREKAAGPDSRETALALANLGKFYVDHGEYEKAEPVYRRQFEETEKDQGDGLALTPILADQIVIYTKLARDAELTAAYQRQITVTEKMFGQDSPALIKPLTECAQLLRKQKRDAEAEPLEARANALKAAMKK